MRGYLFVLIKIKRKLLNTFFNAYWNDNLDLSNEEEFSKLLNKIRNNQEIFFHGNQKSERKMN
jgi:hypothetical protein